MNILGISSYYHDSSACLLREGRVVCGVAEERFTRAKHDNRFPINAINFCLEEGGLSIDDIDYMAFYEKPVLKFERVLSQCIEGFPRTTKMFVKSMPLWFTEKLRIPHVLKKRIGYKGDVFFINHHLSHAAGAFYPSPFEEAAIVTIDGVGEWSTTAYGIGLSNDISIKEEIVFPHSMGLFYSTMTAFLGFKVNNDESKVMALRAYGELDRTKNNYYKKLKEVVTINEDGSFSLNIRYFTYHFKDKMPSYALTQLLNTPVRLEKEPINKEHKDIAAATQLIYEDVFFAILNHVQKQTKLENLVIAGGCAMNSTANGNILAETKFKNIWIPPDAGDGGTSMGAAYFAYHSLLGNKNRHHLKNPYLGPKTNNKQVEAFLLENNIKYYKFKSEKELVEKTAQLIHDNKILGWFQGKMEWGPRALGARSVLSNPCHKENREKMLKIKKRENFRPLCPAVCKEDANTFFHYNNHSSESSNYISMVYSVRDEWIDKIAAVVHKDKTSGLQTVERDLNQRYYDVIKYFGKLSGVPIIINTSFNLGGEPIVNDPRVAYECMMETGLDYLVIEDFLIKREDNL